MEVYQLFPTAIGKFQYDNITKKEIDYVTNKLKYGKNAGNSISEDKEVLTHKPLKKINDFIQSSLNEYFQTIYKPESGVSIYTTISWTNITHKDEWHHKHAHPNSFLSGVFYFQTTEDDKIHFFKEGYKQLNPAITEFNIYNSETWWYPVEIGRLLIFPSNTFHEVYVIKHDTPRISLSFNTWLRGPIGDKNMSSYFYSK
jgi:uncharacterized protein (TIGR02466 family)